jgi:hypothetical protein
VLVCRVEPIASASESRELLYVNEALWQVESEFKEDSRAAIVDFSKLVLGSAANKLFCGPLVQDVAAFLRPLRSVGLKCSGNVFAVLLPHPRSWDRTSLEIHLWRLIEGEWITQ